MSSGQLSLTSLWAYQEVLREGKVGRAQATIIVALREASGPMTGREVADRTAIDGAWKRLPELERAGLIRRVGTTRCSVTGRRATAWGPAR